LAAAPLDPGLYAVEGLDLLPTPRLLVFRRHVEGNIDRMRSLLEEVVPGSGFRHLSSHAKTHKSLWTAERLVAAGVESHKCTLHELDLLLEAGARDVFVAYPLLAHDADRVAERAAGSPGTRITAQIGRLEHAERLGAAARRHGVEIDCLIDLDVGNRRTGVRPDAAPDLVRAILGSRRAGALRIRGLHAYDGHNRGATPGERAACAEEAMAEVVRCARSVETAGARVERIIAGGTPGFLPDLRELVVRHRVDADVRVSPGTWIYWDSAYEKLLPGMFTCAALVLAQVIDGPADDLVTLNVGYKRWAIDQGPVESFSAPGLEVVSTSEEHTVLRAGPGTRLSIEDRVLLAPRHVCPTVNLWETFTLVGPDGRVEAAALPVSGRNR
jgi:D-serine deaminase-like pyridoxal phosphate-dependent protein